MTKLSFCVAATGPDLRLVARLDDVVVYDGYPELDSVIVEHEFNDDQEQEHTLVFELQNKLPEHTEINAAGEIIKDRCITIADVAFDGIALGHMFTEVASYHHDHNGTTDPVTEPFYGVMGCNGRAEMTFSTPIYLWLLENM